MTDTNSPAPPTDAAPKPVNLNLVDAQEFINLLQEMCKSNRGQLAQLKRNVGEPLPGRGTTWFYSLLYKGNSGRRLRYGAEYFLVATLYDLNRYDSKGAANLGASMKLAVAQANANEESTIRRLQILLDAEYESPNKEQSEFAFRLRQTVQWLDGKQVGINWAQLLVDVCNWSPSAEYADKYGARNVQKKWARSFFDNPRAAQSPENPAA